MACQLAWPGEKPASQAPRPREPAGKGERVLVGHLDDLVTDGPVVRPRPEILADALDQVWPAGPAGVHRALRVGSDDLHPAAGDLLEVPADAGDRATGAH